MRNLKRVLSLALAAMMLIGMMVVGASAVNTKDFADYGEIEHTEAVDTMVALNVIDGIKSGDTYNFKPEGTLKRSEMSKIISYVMNGGVEPVLGVKPVPTYSDIDDHWSEKYVEYCTSMGIIAGVGQGKFNPEGTLTGEQAAKMLLTAMGYNAEVFGFVGAGWNVNVNRYANEAGLYKELGDMDPSQPISRDNACQLAYNAIQAYMMVRTWNQNQATGEVTETYVLADGTANVQKNTLLMDKFDGNVAIGYLTGYTYDEAKGVWTYTFENGAMFGVATALTDNNAITVGDPVVQKSTVDYTAFYGKQVKVIYNTEDNNIIYGVYAHESNVVVSAASGMIDSYDATARTVKIDGTNYKLNGAPNTIPVYLMKSGNTSYHLSDMAADTVVPYMDQLHNAYTYELVDNNGDSKIDVVILVPMTVAQITYVGSDTVTFNNGVGMKNKDDIVIYDGYAQGDWVYFIDGDFSSTEIDTAVTAELQTATVDGVRGSDVATGYSDYQLGGEWFAETVYSAGTGLNGEARPSYSVADAEVNDTIEYVTLGSVVFYAKIVDVAATTKNIAMIITADNINASGASGNLGGSSVDAKLLLADGTTVTKSISKVTTNGVSTDVSTVTDLNSYMGHLVTYRVDSNGDYELTLVNNQNMAGYKSYHSGAAYSNKTIAGRELADDATVFVLVDSDYAGTVAYNSTNSGKVYTGREFKNEYGTGTFGAANTGCALVTMVDGFNYAKVAMIIADKKPVINTGSNYGYLTAGAFRTVDTATDKTYLNVTLWTDDGEVTAKFESTDAPDVYPRGSVITYDEKGEGEIKNVSLVTLTDAAVTGWSESTGKIQLSTGLTSEVNNDTVVIYVDSKNGKGAEGGKVQLGQDSNNDDVADVDNVRYMGTSTVLNLLLVDVNNKMYDNPVAGNLVLDASLTADQIEEAIDDQLTEFGEVSVDFSNITKAPTIPVASAKTLTISGLSDTVATKVELANGAALNVTADNLDKLTVTADAGSTVTINGVKVVAPANGVITVPAPAGRAAATQVTLTFDSEKALINANMGAATEATIDSTKLGNYTLALAKGSLTDVDVDGQAIIDGSTGDVMTSGDLDDIQIVKGGIKLIGAATLDGTKLAKANDTLKVTVAKDVTLTANTNKTYKATDADAVVVLTKTASGQTVTLSSGKVALGNGAAILYGEATITGASANTTVALSGSTLTATLNAGGTFKLGDATYTGGTIVFDGTNVTVSAASSLALSKAGNVTVTVAKDVALTVNSSAYTAKDAAASVKYTYDGSSTHTVALVSGKVEVASNKAITLNGTSYTAVDNAATVSATTNGFSLDAGKIKLAPSAATTVTGTISLAAGTELALDCTNGGIDLTGVTFSGVATGTASKITATVATNTIAVADNTFYSEDGTDAAGGATAITSLANSATYTFGNVYTGSAGSVTTTTGWAVRA